MTLKKSYKIIISVIIVAIFISSAVAYYYPRNDTQYYVTTGLNIQIFDRIKGRVPYYVYL